MPNNKNFIKSLNKLVDDDGLKTDVKITMTDETLWKIVGGLVLAGGGIAIIAHVAKNIFPNKHLEANTKVLLEIRDSLKR